MPVWGEAEDLIVMHKDFFGVYGQFYCKEVIIEEPESPLSTIDRSHCVNIEEIHSPPPNTVDVEREVEEWVSKRKREEENKAESKAKRICQQFQREGIALEEIIDVVAKDHGELHEKATLIRLSLENEREKIVQSVCEEARAYKCVNLPFDYGLDAAEAYDGVNMKAKTGRKDYVSLADLEDSVLNETQPAPVVSPPSRKRAKFVSPVKKC